MRSTRAFPWIAACLTGVLLGAAIVLDALSSRSGEPGWTSFVFPLAVAASTGVGLVLATNRPENVIGRLLLVNGLVLSLSGLATSYAAYGLLDHPGSLPAAGWALLWDQRTWPLLFAAFTAIAFVFPDGHLPSARWRPPAILAAVSFAALTVLSLFEDHAFDKPFAAVPSPLPQAGSPVFV
jgi:hypothetical protein